MSVTKKHKWNQSPIGAIDRYSEIRKHVAPPKLNHQIFNISTNISTLMGLKQFLNGKQVKKANSYPTSYLFPHA
jgi:hypothetical protein